jgi:hypothetical protein
MMEACCISMTAAVAVVRSWQATSLKTFHVRPQK